MDRDTGMTVKPITLVSAFYTLDSGNTTPCASSWAFCAVLMYFQFGRVRTYTDFLVWCNNYDILATNGKPGNGATQWHCYCIQETTGLDALAKAVACSQRLT